MPPEAKLHDAIAKLASVWLSFLQELVRTKSVTGFEQECQGMVAQRMKDLGVFDREVFLVPGPPFHYTGRIYANRPNVVGRIPGTGSSGFILNAHIDTAPVEDPDSWTHPPFSPVVQDGRIYGRGALDDKAGVAMMLCLAEAFLITGLKLPGSLILESVIEDEDSGNGTLACTQAGYAADAAIVIDGTWPFRIIDAHLGQLWLTFDIAGVPVAACSHALGKNPVNAACTLIRSFEDFISRKNIGQFWHGMDRPYFLSTGAIHAGAWPGAIPEKCSIACQAGFPPPETPESMGVQLEDVARTVSLATGCRIAMKTGAVFLPPFENRNNRMVRVLAETISRLRGDEMKASNPPVRGHCDLRHFKTASGEPSCACLYGPGGGGNPHVRDEYYETEHFIPVAQNIASAILAWYGYGK